MATTFKHSYKPESCYIILGNITANDEESGAINIWEKITEYKARGNLSFQIIRSAGATNIIEINVEMRMLGGTWLQVATITALSGDSSAMVLATGKVGAEVRIIVVEYGTNNVLEAHLILS